LIQHRQQRLERAILRAGLSSVVALALICITGTAPATPASNTIARACARKNQIETEKEG
jgi:hypothetical protein